MTPAEVAARVRAIKEMAGDPEAAHGAEDDLRAEVLEAIRDGAKRPALLAYEALRTTEADFPRWTA